MSKKPKYKYISYLRYAVENQYEHLVAKFAEEEVAEQYVATLPGGRVIDTKPEIPKDAKYITWKSDNNPGLVYFAERINKHSWDVDGNMRYSNDELLRKIGNSKVTVLDPRKDKR